MTSRCPTCNSPSPERHPAQGFEGEVTLCTDAWHAPAQHEPDYPLGPDREPCRHCDQNPCQCRNGSQPEPAAPTVVEPPAHTDHPGRHWDRTCPACAIEPDMRHPKIQRLIGSKARLSIELQLIEDLLENPDCEMTSVDMEYWGPVHDKLREKLNAATQPRAALTRDDIRAIFLANGFTIKPGCDDLKEYVYNAARAIEAAHGITADRGEK